MKPLSETPFNQHIADLRAIHRIDADIVRRDRADRIAKRFEAMNAARARQARRQLHVSAGLALLALMLALFIFHDTPARTAALVLEAEAQGAW